MKYSESEIINALKVIKETCEESEMCKDCPLSIGELNKCGIRYNKREFGITPNQWKIVGETPKSLFLH